MLSTISQSRRLGDSCDTVASQLQTVNVSYNLISKNLNNPFKQDYIDCVGNTVQEARVIQLPQGAQVTQARQDAGVIQSPQGAQATQSLREAQVTQALHL